MNFLLAKTCLTGKLCNIYNLITCTSLISFHLTKSENTCCFNVFQSFNFKVANKGFHFLTRTKTQSLIRDLGMDTEHGTPSFLPSFDSCKRFLHPLISICNDGSRLRTSRKRLIHEVICFFVNVSYSWIISAWYTPYVLLGGSSHCSLSMLKYNFLSPFHNK